MRPAGLIVACTALFSAAPRARADEAMRARLAWLPADTRSVSGAPPGASPFLAFVAQTMGHERPPCWSSQMATLDDTFQVWRARGDQSAFVIHGRLDRAALEACMADALAVLGRSLPGMRLEPRLRRDGAVTEVSTIDGHSAYVAWGPTFAIWHEDRARAEALLAAVGSKRKPIPLDRVIARVEASGLSWSATVEDLTRHFLGIPSQGATFGLLTFGPGRSTLGGAVLFGSAKEATRAERAFKAQATSASRSAEIRSFLASVETRVAGSELGFTIDGARLADPALVAALQRELMPTKP
jgi:hypothetical protein